MPKSVTKRELAAALPNNRGGRGVHLRTIDRRVRRGELPKPDLAFSDGTQVWYFETLRAVNIRVELFSDAVEATPEGAAA